MNIRDAILKAADHIERNPGEFNFQSVFIPSAPGCGTPGCALGWIGHFAGVHDPSDLSGYWEREKNAWGLCEVNVIGSCDLPFSTAREFYRAMDAVYSDVSWRDSAQNCATALRAYADKYHPENSPVVEIGSWAEIARLCGYTVSGHVVKS